MQAFMRFKLHQVACETHYVFQACTQVLSCRYLRNTKSLPALPIRSFKLLLPGFQKYTK